MTFKTSFFPVIELPKDYPVFDLSSEEGQRSAVGSIYGIGRYNEKRPNLYLGENYEEEGRDIHMGVDIGAPEGTPVYAFYEGKVWGVFHHEGVLDYGPTLITEHNIESKVYWVLWGHLNLEVLERWSPGDQFKSGQVIAHLGSQEENGGWPPHLHFQVSLIEPSETNMPGVVSEAQLKDSLKKFPDPRCFLGPLY